MADVAVAAYLLYIPQVCVCVCVRARVHLCLCLCLRLRLCLCDGVSVHKYALPCVPTCQIIIS